MPSMNSKSFTQLVSDFATAVQGAASTLLDFSVGSILLAVGNATSAVTVWLESLILTLLQATRLGTSSGSDVDSFIGDFGLTRLPAIAATGQVTFTRFTPTMQATIAPGVIVQTGDGMQAYTVIADPTQLAWSVTQNAYVIPAGTASAIATVQAVTAGTGANVSAGAINTIAVAIPFVDTVSNALAFGNGENAETDPQVRTGFVAFIASLAKATVTAVENAVQSMQVGAACLVTEFQWQNGTYAPGYFYATVDDGSGAPSATFVSDASIAIDAVRACGIQYNTFAVIGVQANVTMTITAAQGYQLSALEPQVQAAILAYLQSLQLANTCSWAKLAAAAFTVPGVADVTAWTLNGGQADIVPEPLQRIIPGAITVN